jgi:TolB protein
MAVWRQRNADSLLAGSITRLADGRFDIRFRLWDAVRGQDLGGQGYAVVAADLRLAAHRIADFVYEKLTGEKGVFSTRLAYVSRAGSRHTLWVADADGENAQAALASPEPIISPAWSPTGTQLAYVSFESRKPVVYIHELANGRRRLLANFRGSNSAPAWSPDGRSIALTLSRDGGSQLYLMDASGGEARRMTQSSGIDTEPVFSPDGRQIYFVSDRGGAPQVYRMPAGGGAAERVTFSGGYNISPTLSPDGQKLAYVTRQGGAFKLQVMDLASGGAVTSLTDTTADESPSFAPNGRLLVYATRAEGREALMTTTLMVASRPGWLDSRVIFVSPAGARSRNEFPDLRNRGALTMKRLVIGCALTALLAACGSSVKLDDAPPVEDRSGTLNLSGPSPSTGGAPSSTGQSGVAAVNLTPGVADAAGPKITNVIYFDFDSYVVKPEFQSVVEAHARYLQADRKRQTVVEGHTDERGGREYNLALGQRRAEAVRRSLGLLGVTDAQVEAVSFGKEKPAVAGSDDDAMARNRRAEIKYR